MGCRTSDVPPPAKSEAASPSGSSSRPPPESPFELVAEPATVRVVDFGEATLLLSTSTARLLAPRAPLASARDVSVGLPKALLGEAPILSVAPLLGVDQYPHGAGNDFVWFTLTAGGWKPVALPENVETLLPLGSGAVAIEWASIPDGDPGGVPAGNATRAWRVAEDGSVACVAGWPNAMTWNHKTAGESIWAIAARPGVPGKFLLHVPVHGEADLFAIPGRSTCRGSDRAIGTESTVEVTNDGAVLDLYGVDSAPICGAGHPVQGRFRFALGSATWTRMGDLPATSVVEPHVAPTSRPSMVTASGTEFRLEGGTVTTRIGGHEAHCELDPGGFGELMTTARGREVWARLGQHRGSALYRYRWPATTR